MSDLIHFIYIILSLFKHDIEISIIHSLYTLLGKDLSHKSELTKRENDVILLISEGMNGKRKNQIIEDCIENNIEIFNVPNLETWKHFKSLKFAELL